MLKKDRYIYYLLAGLCFVASSLNLMEILSLLPTSVSFKSGLSVFVFCFIAHLSYLGWSAVLGLRYELVKWPLWLMLIHPLVGMTVFSIVNKKRLFFNVA